MFRARSFVGSGLVAASLAFLSCNAAESPEAPLTVAGRSSSIATSPDGKTVYVVNADLDSVSILDVGKRALVKEILLASAHPAADAKGAYTPAVLPRALALSPDASTLYVTGERSSALYAIDLGTSKVTRTVTVGSEPFGVLVATDGSAVFVACSQDAKVVRVDAKSFAITASTPTPDKPLSLSASPDGSQILTTHLLGPGVTSIDPTSMALRATWTIPPTQPGTDQTLAHGSVRGLYAAIARPGTDEIWVAHALLGINTPQPTLDFKSTAFPALSVLHADGTYEHTYSTSSQEVVKPNGALTDVVSGPRDVAFTHDGHYAVMVDMDSEDLIVFDAAAGLEAPDGLLRPMPGHMPEGIAISPDERFAYVDERNTGDVAVISLDRSTGPLVLAVSGAPIPRYVSDPMPPTIRLGQHLYYSANSREYAITNNSWISCATCHMEGRSDAVTWDFTPGPRDTPSTAGGVLDTGFLFRTADRREVQDYWHTINIEQGGNFDPVINATLLDAIAAFVNYGMPLPVPPTTDPALVKQGKMVFENLGCGMCHSGPRFTDSGSGPGNSTANLAMPILHDVGTCVMPIKNGPYPDVAHPDVDNVMREACLFDTPSLNGVADSPPYLHDGSAATLRDVIDKTDGGMWNVAKTITLSSADEDALVEYLRSL